ncbi:unnamed protein product [Dovyalis caffra]|uniref:Ribosomal protein L2 n=1 Tax=Dovyalis caffra TaxID=77055 RepID=A0AAV1R4T9_9ROSI|nr:unnamed protein product [Dovyalis caffra]
MLNYCEDLTKGNRNGGESIYGTKFVDRASSRSIKGHWSFTNVVGGYRIGLARKKVKTKKFNESQNHSPLHPHLPKSVKPYINPQTTDRSSSSSISSLSIRMLKCGGDLTKGNRIGGESIYGTKYADRASS